MPIITDGPVTRGTRQNLIDGLRARPMPQRTVDAILNQVIPFTERLASTYEAQIAAGEVGTGGSGAATDAEILAARPPTCLLYGRVQSGKTAAMVMTSALCLDNGFKTVIVLTADNVRLVEQTANRFKDLNGPRVFSTVRADERYEWEGQEDAIRDDLARDGLVLVCAKDAFHLPEVLDFLRRIEAPAHPAIVFDDEADAATPDTTLAARTSGRPNAPQVASTINRRVVENDAPGEEGESVNEVMPHSLFVQVTATPFILFLQRKDSRIRPNITHVLEPGEGYCGGDTFFAGYDPQRAEANPPLVTVPATEAQNIMRGLRVPEGLAASITFFVLSAAAKGFRDGMWPTEGYKHLSHTSHRINQHTVVSNHIDTQLTDLRRAVRAGQVEGEAAFAVAYAELRRTVMDLPPLARLLPTITAILGQAEIFRINADTDVPRYGPRINFIVGGNILGRGLTIDDLLVTYYIREAQTSQMDTVWQHARMYGYRTALMPYTRVYLTGRLAARFKDIHESEEQLRELLRREMRGEEVPIRVATGSRPTRTNALERGALRVFNAGIDQLIPRFLVEDAVRAEAIRDALVGLGVPIDEPNRDQRLRRISYEEFIRLIEAVPTRADDPGRWSAPAIVALVDSFRDQYNGTAPVYVRGLEADVPPEDGWIRGRLSGPEIAGIRAAAGQVPTLVLLYIGTADQPRGWFPELVLPDNTNTYIVNPLN